MKMRDIINLVEAANVIDFSAKRQEKQATDLDAAARDLGLDGAPYIQFDFYTPHARKFAETLPFHMQVGDGFVAENDGDYNGSRINNIRERLQAEGFQWRETPFELDDEETTLTEK